MAKTSIGFYSVFCIFMLFMSFFGQSYGQLKTGFYAGKCGTINAEQVVYDIVRAAFFKDKTVVAALLRMQFHDCFVRVRIATLMFQHIPLRNVNEIIAYFYPRQLTSIYYHYDDRDVMRQSYQTEAAQRKKQEQMQVLEVMNLLMLVSQNWRKYVQEPCLVLISLSWLLELQLTWYDILCLL